MRYSVFLALLLGSCGTSYYRTIKEPLPEMFVVKGCNSSCINAMDCTIVYEKEINRYIEYRKNQDAYYKN